MIRESLLDRILWTQLARALHGSQPEWQPESASARAIRGVLESAELDPEESGIVERWDERRESSRKLFDRLLQARVNRALQEGLRAEAKRLGLTELPRVPRVFVVREGVREVAGPATATMRGNPKRTIVEFLSSGSVDVAALAPGAKLEELVDLLVLANQDATDALRATLGPEATVLRPEAAADGAGIDLMLAGQSPSIQVFDIERELVRLEEVLRNAIPPERRPAKSAGTWSFGQDLTGELLGGKYRIRALKGKGAFKTVYEGEDEMLGARVAVAVLNPKGARSPRALEHFQDEARKLTTLDHENIVRWITFDRTAEGLHYFVMEYLDGEELEKVLRREGRLAPRRVAAILLQALGALRRAHARGKHGSLLHLDLKPENVFLMPSLAPGEPERVKVIDFGIGQHVGAEVRAAEHPELRSLLDLPAEELGKSIGSLALPEDEEPEAEAPPAAGGVRRRVQRARGGTLLYASPEQCKHLAGHKDIAALDGRSDLYSLGVMAFRMLTGQFPFARITTAHQAIQNHLEVAPRKVGSLGIKIPRDLAAFVDRCLVKDREKRWKDANEAYEALERILRPRLSPVKVGAAITVAAVLGFGALYFTRGATVAGLTLVDPSIENVSERVVTELHLGPKSPSRLLRLESDSAWDREAPIRLLDAAGGKELAGWSARWSDPAAGTIEIARLDEAKSAAALLEIDGGRRERWLSERLVLEHLGAWRIASATVDGHDPGKRLDPRRQTLALELGGDPEGRAALESIEVRHEGVSLGRTSAASASAHGELARYAGPALDALFTGAAHEVELEIVARDRAGQEEPATLTLRLAGEPADFGPSTGFAAKAEIGSALYSPGETQVLLPENALRIEATGAARVRVFLEPTAEPVLVRDIADPKEPLLLTLSELGISGKEERSGTMRLELDDSPWVDRATSEARTRNLRFRFTPEAPAIQVQLVASGFERVLESDETEGPNHVNAGQAARLLVSTPPGTSLWIEASCRPEMAPESASARLSRSRGAFELPLELAAEGPYRIAVRKYVLLAGEERGPLIPPEHVFRIQVDRTAPEVELVLEGDQAGPDAEEALFRGEFSQRIAARVRDPALASLRWRLTLPDGTQRNGALEPAAEVVLPALLEYQEAEGRYALELVASDRADNTHLESRAWQVARTGPKLALLEPLALGEERRWVLGAGHAWDVRVRASDPNGVAQVRARVVYRGGVVRELELVRVADEVWAVPESDRPSAHFWWVDQELALELTATDVAGFETRRTERGLVPELPHERVIVPRGQPAEAAGGAMVEIVAGGDYVFGGRSGEGRRPWMVELPRDALRSFYLDAREVSRSEFLEFLRAEGGYADSRWWPEGSEPDAERVAALTSQLGGDPAHAATGVTWSEARAYAAWRGKRLPTLLEWEFAVRGHEYHESPAETPLPGAPADWPINLCAGVREWTATPERLVADALDFGSQCRRYPARLLAAGPDDAESARADASSPLPASARREGSHWAVGSGADEAPSWSAKFLRQDEPGHEDVGFRCALDRESAHSLLDRGEYDTVPE